MSGSMADHECKCVLSASIYFKPKIGSGVGTGGGGAGHTMGKK